MPNDGRIGRLTMDGTTMTVEVRDRGRYRSYEYSNPDARAAPPERLAAAIEAIDGRLDIVYRRPAHEMLVRGKLEFVRGGVFLTRCGSDTLMEARGSLGRSLDSLRAKAYQDSTIVRAFLVRVRGMQPNLALPARRRLREFAQFNVDSVLSAEGWAERRGC
ncbi:MAG: hypothetical protein V4558_12980 [Gemmatimonadota bacterium]